MDWDNPAQRAALIERVGIEEYNRQFEQHIKDSTVAVVNGCPPDLAELIKHDAAAMQSRRGERFQVSTSGQYVVLGLP